MEFGFQDGFVRLSLGARLFGEEEMGQPMRDIGLYDGASLTVVRQHPVQADDEFTILVEKQDNQDLGLQVEHEIGSLLVLGTHADPGTSAISSWNASNPHLVIGYGDELLAVNNARGDPDKMINEVRSSSTLEITVRRGPPALSVTCLDMPFHYQLTVDDIRKVFSRYGGLRGVEISNDGQAAAVKFQSLACAQAAMHDLDGRSLNGLHPGKVRLHWLNGKPLSDAHVGSTYPGFSSSIQKHLHARPHLFPIAETFDNGLELASRTPCIPTASLTSFHSAMVPCCQTLNTES